MPSALTVLWKETHSGKRLFLYISAFVTAMLFIIGVVSKIQHWPLAALILMVASLSGIFAFIPALLAAKLKDQENRSKKIVYILGAAGLIFYTLALLFKIQHWPGASLFMMCGVVIIFPGGFSMVHMDHLEERQKCQRKIHRDGYRFPCSCHSGCNS